ncbi:YjbQ family protein [Candidatus Woesearchaeota archaeon]|nr:YjbQ family protein [Candidatus Woesearchaeota archaeon]
MPLYSRILELNTKKNIEICDITDKVKEAINESGFKNAHVIVQSLHTTVGIYVNESEAGLLEDFKNYLERHAGKSEKYCHDNLSERDCPPDEPKNGHSHIKSALYSNPSVALVVIGGQLQIGKWQRVLFAEFDGPCPRKHKTKRKCLISILSE